MKRLIAVILTGLTLVSTAGLAATSEFPRPPEIEPAVRFWTKTFADVSTDAGLIHDRHNLGVIYETIQLRSDRRRARKRQVRARKAHYREILRNIARKDRSQLNAEEQRVLALWPEGVSDARLRRAASHGLRFQLGQADKFRAGLVRSGAWEPHIRDTLEDMGLPEELAALPHVESSFNPRAYSRVGAAGIWQFTRSTGRRYMRIDHVVDERMDPFAASIAAAQLLQHNHSVTNNWALAITAYNHGLAGIRRAVRQVGSDNIADLIEHYSSRTWGFASRNFYPSFLAAVEVDFHAEKYFGRLQRDEPLTTETVELPFYTPIDAVVAAVEVERDQLRRLNRALRDPVWSGKKRVPRGYSLRVPVGPDRPSAKQLVARIDSDQRYYAQIPDRYHRVRPGEALSTIAARYNVSTREIVALNNLRSRHYIRAGQNLRLPVDGQSQQRSLAGAKYYEVNPGDTLSGIAKRVGLSASSLAAANDLGNKHRIYPGQRLRVDGESVSDAERTVALADTGDSETASDAASASMIEDTEPASEASATQATDESTTGGAAETSETDGADEAKEASEVDGQVAISSEDAAEEIAVGDASQALTADPADYSVTADGTIEVQAAETLGHYAEWLDLRASQLRRINGMRYGKPVIVGKRLKLDFSHVTPEQFQQRRESYHQELQARFFEQFRIEGTETTLVKTGDSLWTLAHQANNVPVWLLRQYNPDLDFDDLHPGMPVTLPKVVREPTAEKDQSGQGDDARADAQAEGSGSGA